MKSSRVPLPNVQKGCKTNVKYLNKYQKAALVDEYLSTKGEYKVVARKYGIKEGTLRKWVKMNRDGIKFKDGYKKRSYLTEDQESSLKRKLENNKFQIRTEDYVVEVRSMTAETAKIKQQSPPILSRQWYWNLEKKLGIKTLNAEVTTNARAEATSDILNFVSFAAMNYLYVKLLEIRPQMILNADATQFKVGNRTDGKVQVKAISLKKGPVKATPKARDPATGMAFFIKYFLLMSAAGNAHTPVYVIANPQLDAEEMYPYLVRDLGASTEAGSAGWVVFCKTRGCNKAFFNWYQSEIVQKTIVGLRKIYSNENENNFDEIAWFQLDGEPIQIECFKSPDVIEHFNDLNIVVGKPPASTTEATQAADRGNCFKGAKTTLRYFKNFHFDDRIYRDMLQTLDTVFNNHNTAVRESFIRNGGNLNNYIAISTIHCKMAKDGIIAIQHSFAKSVVRSTIRDSWADIGVYPYDLNTIMDQCKTPTTKEERSIISAALPELAKKFSEDGELADEYLNLPGIDIENPSQKDHLVQYRRRSIILTHPKVLAESVRVKECKLKAYQIANEKKMATAAKKKEKKANATPPPNTDSNDAAVPLRINLRISNSSNSK